MEPSFNISSTLSKVERYEVFTKQFSALIEGEHNMVSVLANAAAALKEAFQFFWVGFYLVNNEEWLSLGPFQGTIACSRIRKGRGVCGMAWQEAHTFLVPDVDQFPGHIACSSKSRSEIVVPLLSPTGCVQGVLDIDSDQLNAFDETDRLHLETICRILSDNLFAS